MNAVFYNKEIPDLPDQKEGLSLIVGSHTQRISLMKCGADNQKQQTEENQANAQQTRITANQPDLAVCMCTVLYYHLLHEQNRHKMQK